MKAKARYFAAVREITGKQEETFEIPDKTTVKDLLLILSAKYGQSLRDYIFISGTEEPVSNLNFLLDGNNVSLMNGMKTALYEGCTFAIIPPVGGGYTKG
ncbi:MAG: MoaD family protein [Candidatus Bathyarchaeota archaeon]|nr:MoaD family protein [Candidatus Bathyarchaeota archaeon]